MTNEGALAPSEKFTSAQDDTKGHSGRFSSFAKVSRSGGGIEKVTGASAARLYLLVPDRECYKNLCRMITAAKLRVIGEHPDGSAKYPAKGESRVRLADLEQFGRGMICLAGGALSPLARRLTRGDDPRALCDHLQAIFGRGNLYIDLQRHLDPDEERLNRKLLALAGASRIPLVATNDVCFAGGDRALLDVLTCIRLGTTLEEAGRALWINHERHLKTPAAMTSAVSRPAHSDCGVARDRRSLRFHAAAISAIVFPTIRSRPGRRRTAICAR